MKEATKRLLRDSTTDKGLPVLGKSGWAWLVVVSRHGETQPGLQQSVFSDPESRPPEEVCKCPGWQSANHADEPSTQV